MTVVVLNPITLGVSEYSLPWVGVGAASGEVFGLAVSGLQQLSTGTVSGYMETGQLFLAEEQEFNLQKLTVMAAGAASGELGVTATTLERRVQIVHPQVLVEVWPQLDEQEIVMGTQPAARAYQLRVDLPEDGRLRTVSAYVNPVRHRRG